MKNFNRAKRLLYLLAMALLIQPLQAQSIELDKQLGAENAAMVAANMGIYHHATTKFVQSIGARLVSGLENPQFEYQFQIVDDPIPNAFALPGGYVFVTRGILSLVNSEDELACVMAHEIIHAARRHAIQQMKKSILPRLLEVPGKIVGNVINRDLGDLLNVPIKTSNDLLLASYSRKFETESDVLGVTLASKVGYDPLAMTSILTRLSTAVEAISNQEEKKSYFDDHPYTPDRVNTIQETSKNLQWNSADKLSPDFPEPLAGMVFGGNPAKGIFQDNTFLHPDLGFGITFPENWETINQPEAVGAIHSDRKGAIFVGLDDPGKSPATLAKEFTAALKQEYPRLEMKSAPYLLNSNQGHLISLYDDTGSERMYIYMLWVKMNDLMFKVVGLGPTGYTTQLQSAAESLHILTSAERASVKQMVIDIVTSRQNETFATISKRVNSPLKGEINALLNGLSKDQPLAPGTKVKVIIEKDY